MGESSLTADPQPPLFLSTGGNPYADHHRRLCNPSNLVKALHHNDL